MFTAVIVQLPTHLLQAVIDRLRREGENQDISAAATLALQQWLAQDTTPAGAAPARGYQWKSLFLPDGTVLRSWSYGGHNVARVEGNRLMHDGRPGDKRYTLAALLRDQLAKQERDVAATAPLPAMLAAAPATPPPPRNVGPMEGWDLPERRAMRFRLEDVGLD